MLKENFKKGSLIIICRHLSSKDWFNCTKIFCDEVKTLEVSKKCLELSWKCMKASRNSLRHHVIVFMFSNIRNRHFDHYILIYIHLMLPELCTSNWKYPPSHPHQSPRNHPCHTSWKPISAFPLDLRCWSCRWRSWTPWSQCSRLHLCQRYGTIAPETDHQHHPVIEKL